MHLDEVLQQRFEFVVVVHGPGQEPGRYWAVQRTGEGDSTGMTAPQSLMAGTNSGKLTYAETGAGLAASGEGLVSETVKGLTSGSGLAFVGARAGRPTA